MLQGELCIHTYINFNYVHMGQCSQQKASAENGPTSKIEFLSIKCIHGPYIYI